MKNLIQRVVTAAVLLPLVGVLVLYPQPLVFDVLVAVVTAIAASEYFAISLQGAGHGLRFLISAIAIALGQAVYFRPGLTLVWVMAALLATGISVLLAPGEIRAAGARLGMAGFGVFYVGLLPATAALLQRDVPGGRGPWWVLMTVVVVFGNDAGAYFTGKLMGRHKLYPTISPGKTLEGGVGGLIFSFMLAVLARGTVLPELTWGDCLLIAIPAGILGPCGDLMESLLKRAAGVKDSGNLLPGHGGVLDRIDALLFVLPWIYTYAVFLR